MGKYLQYRGKLCAEKFYELTAKTRMKKSTVDDLYKYFVDGLPASEINSKQLMSNRIGRIVRKLQSSQDGG